MFCPSCHNALSISDICDECGWKKSSTYTSKKSSKKRKSSKSAYSARLRKERQEEEARLAKTAIEGEVVDVETWKEGEGWSAPRRVEVTMDDGRRYRLADRLSGISEHAISDFTDEMNTKQWELIEDPSEDEEAEEVEEVEESSDEDAPAETTKKRKLFLATYDLVLRDHDPYQCNYWWEVVASPYSLPFSMELETRHPHLITDAVERDIIKSIEKTLRAINNGNPGYEQYAENTWRAVHLLSERDSCLQRQSQMTFGERRQFMIAWIDKVVDYLDPDTIRRALKNVDHIEVT